jgi:hypothetical protein
VIILFGLALAWIGSQRRWFGAHAATLSARLPDWPRIADLLVVAVSYWVLTAAARTDLTPFRSRYIHPGAIVIVLLVAEFLAYRVIPSRTKVVASGLCAAILLLSIPFLARNAAKYRSASEILTAQITALQIARRDAPAGFQPSPLDDPQIRAALLFAAERTAGSSPAISPAALLRSPNSARAAADETLIRISLARPQVALPQCRQTSRRRPLIQGMSFPPGTALVLFNGSSTPAKVSLRRLASTPTELSSPVAAHRSIQIRLETDDVTAPWHITASVGSRLLVCSSA